jgi:TolB-like protein/class 3 adenylate cyclase
MPTEIKREIELKIAHVLFIDIVAYSKMASDDQRAAIEKLNQIVQSTDEFRKSESENRLLKLATGDGMALIFYDSPEAPVECALEISRALKEHPQLRLRMGAHSGPVSGVVDVNGRANVAGAGINMAQRVMDCGDAGHILLSQRIAEDLEQFKHWRPHLYHLGECEVKHGEKVDLVNLFTAELGNSERPKRLTKSDEQIPTAPISIARPRVSKRGLVIIVCVALAGLLIASFLFWQGQKPKTSAVAATIPEKSIAVLPFENLSRDPDNAYFADGIQDEILTRLSKIADLKVISRTSTQQYQSKPGNLSEIARQLGVAHIVEGSVQKSADAVRVNVQLIKAANDSHLWADTFDRKLTDIFSVESEVAKAIAEQLRAKLTGQEEQVIAAKPTDNPQAYDAYLRGLAYTLKTATTPANSLGAQKYLKEAVRLDPKFALSWAQEVAGDHAAAQETWRQAHRELEPFLKDQPENYTLIGDLALTNMGLGDKAAAFSFVEKAMAVVPIEKDALDGAQSIEVLARVSAQMGEPDRAIAALQKLLSIPYAGAVASNVPLTPALLRLDPMFDPLRNDPRFQRLAQSEAPKS